jgi:hypothetical protein
MSSELPSFMIRSELTLLPRKLHLWLAGLFLGFGACLVCLYFASIGDAHITETSRVLGGLIGVGIFTYMTAWLAGTFFWPDVQTRIGFTVYWAGMTGLGTGYIYGPLFGLAAGAMMVVGLYMMEHILMRPGFVGGIFDGAMNAFGMAGVYLLTTMGFSLMAYHQLLHPRVIASVCVLSVGARLIGKIFVRASEKQLKRESKQTFGYKVSYAAIQLLVYVGLSVLVFLSTKYLVQGICYSVLRLFVECAPRAKKPMSVEDLKSGMFDD